MIREYVAFVVMQKKQQKEYERFHDIAVYSLLASDWKEIR